MRPRFIAGSLAAALVVAFLPSSARALQADRNLSPSESRVPACSTSLYARAIGQGPLVIAGDHDFFPVEVAEA